MRGPHGVSLPLCVSHLHDQMVSVFKTGFHEATRLCAPTASSTVPVLSVFYRRASLSSSVRTPSWKLGSACWLSLQDGQWRRMRGRRTDTSPARRCRSVPSSDTEGRMGVWGTWLALHEKAVWGGEGLGTWGSAQPTLSLPGVWGCRV